MSAEILFIKGFFHSMSKQGDSVIQEPDSGLPRQHKMLFRLRLISESRFDTFLGAVCALVVILYGCWTILTNAVVISGNNFTDLRRLAVMVPIAAALILAYLGNDFEARAPRTVNGSVKQTLEIDNGTGKTQSLLFVGALLAAIFAFGNRYLLFWVLTVLFLGVAYWKGRHSSSLQLHEASSSSWNFLAFAVAVVIAFSAAIWLDRPNVDQTLVINMAVFPMDAPGAPLYASDGLHGIPGAYYLPTYWVQSFELLAALAAQIFNIVEPIRVLHFLLGPLFTVFSVCAAAFCFRRLLPKLWGWACLILAAVLLILRGTYLMYGNFAYVRMFEGKSVFTTAMIPLIITYAINFSIRPGLRNWVLLMFAQVCAIGFTANAIYGAPLAAGFTLLACWRPTWPATRSLFLGLLASMYIVMIGLLIRSIMIRNGLSLDDFQQFVPIDSAVKMVLGEGAILWLWLFALTSAWCLVKDRPTRQWVLAFSFAFTLTCMNPFLDKYWGMYVTAKYLTWRLFWVIPLPVFLALLTTQVIASGFGRLPSQKLIFVLVVTALLLPLALDKPWTEPDLTTQLRAGLKVPEPDYKVAMLMNKLTGSGNAVLAPENISEWVPTFRSHAYPLVARAHYTEAILTVFANHVDVKDVRSRLILSTYVDGDSKNYKQSEDLLRLWLNDNKISVVAVPMSFSRLDEITYILQATRFVRMEYLGYVLFRR